MLELRNKIKTLIKKKAVGDNILREIYDSPIFKDSKRYMSFPDFKKTFYKKDTPEFLQYGLVISAVTGNVNRTETTLKAYNPTFDYAVTFKFPSTKDEEVVRFELTGQARPTDIKSRKRSQISGDSGGRVSHRIPPKTKAQKAQEARKAGEKVAKTKEQKEQLARDTLAPEGTTITIEPGTEAAASIENITIDPTTKDIVKSALSGGSSLSETFRLLQWMIRGTLFLRKLTDWCKHKIHFLDFDRRYFDSDGYGRISKSAKPEDIDPITGRRKFNIEGLNRELNYFQRYGNQLRPLWELAKIHEKWIDVYNQMEALETWHKSQQATTHEQEDWGDLIYQAIDRIVRIMEISTDMAQSLLSMDWSNIQTENRAFLETMPPQVKQITPIEIERVGDQGWHRDWFQQEFDRARGWRIIGGPYDDGEF